MNKKKVVSIEDRIPQLKQVRKKKANRRLVFYLSIFFVLISIIVYLQSPLSNVKHIIITGNTYVTEKEIIEQSKLTTKTNIWTIDHKKIEKIIHNNPVIESVEVQRKLPSTVYIQVIEYKHIGYIQKESKIYPILGNGTILPVHTESIGEAPLILGFTEDEFLKNMVNELEKLPKSILNLISEIHWEPTDENKSKIYLYMNDGFIVDGTIRNFADKMQVYPSIASQLKQGSQGIIHIGVGAYFEEFTPENNNEEVESETEG